MVDALIWPVAEQLDRNPPHLFIYEEDENGSFGHRVNIIHLLTGRELPTSDGIPLEADAAIRMHLQSGGLVNGSAQLEYVPAGQTKPLGPLVRGPHGHWHRIWAYWQVGIASEDTLVQIIHTECGRWLNDRGGLETREFSSDLCRDCLPEISIQNSWKTLGHEAWQGRFNHVEDSGEVVRDITFYNFQTGMSTRYTFLIGDSAQDATDQSLVGFGWTPTLQLRGISVDAVSVVDVEELRDSIECANLKSAIALAGQHIDGKKLIGEAKVELGLHLSGNSLSGFSEPPESPEARMARGLAVWASNPHAARMKQMMEAFPTLKTESSVRDFRKRSLKAQASGKLEDYGWPPQSS